ncbi:NigD-like protein [Bacteroidales bacterium OttesenSCG-928-A17]|nr:NigD-like protein [Bacteroidales bacterium OttesenSCG-928-A17]
MKRILIFIWIVVFFSSCEDASYDYGLDRYYEEIVTAEGNNVFRLDNGETLFTTTKIKLSLTGGERLWIHYTLLDEKTEGFDHTVRVNGLSPVSTGALKALKQQEMQTLKKEPVLFRSLWIGSYFLNMHFLIDYRSTAHTVGLVVDEETLGENPVEIYFTHDKNKDAAGSPVRLFTSFDLREVLEEPQGNKNIRIHVNTSNYGEQVYDLIY